MARIPFVDTHFHLHDMKRPELRYAWLEPDAVHPFLGNIDAINKFLRVNPKNAICYFSSLGFRL